ncbi:MAG TPA: FG-GAP repeat protein, partial [Planctomycetota bacterium]|nr:FG-GAP repeat protein [Planctomycetota bacterium]
MRIIRSGKWTGLLSAAAWLLLLLPGLELVRVAVAITGAWFLEDHEQLGQRTIYADREGGGYRGAPVALGDFDGDGLVDLVLAPMSASSGPEGDRDSGGRVHLIRGNGRIEGVVRIGAPPAEATVLTLEGARDGDMTGTELEVRDLDGDGHDDLLVGAQNYDGGGRDNSGAVWILWGGPHVFASTRSIDLLDAPFEDPAAAGLPRLSRIDGAEPGERLGIWTSAGDFDGDGRADLAIGADQYSITGRNRVGRVWIIYDARELPDVLDLAAPGDVVARTIVGVD